MIDPLWILAAGMVVVVGGILRLRLHAFLALLPGRLVVGVLTPKAALEAHAISKGRTEHQARADAETSVGSRIAKEFGGTVTGIGILIAMAAIIGKCLLDSGTADRIVRSALKCLGEHPACRSGLCGSAAAEPDQSLQFSLKSTDSFTLSQCDWLQRSPVPAGNQLPNKSND